MNGAGKYGGAGTYVRREIWTERGNMDWAGEYVRREIWTGRGNMEILYGLSPGRYRYLPGGNMGRENTVDTPRNMHRACWLPVI